MSTHTGSSRRRQFVRLALILTLSGYVIVAIVGWLSGWRDPAQYGTALITIGMGAALLGAASLLGGLLPSDKWNDLNAWTTGVEDYASQMQQRRKDSTASFYFLLLMWVVGLLLGGGGWAMQALAG